MKGPFELPHTLYAGTQLYLDAIVYEEAVTASSESPAVILFIGSFR